MAKNILSVWILGDQLLAQHPAIDFASKQVGKENVIVCLLESQRRLTLYPTQKKKLVLLLSAMRHYAARLRSEGYRVDLRQSLNFSQGLREHLSQHHISGLVTMAAASYSGRAYQEKLATKLQLPTELLPNTQFLIGRYNPIPEPPAGKRVVMEHFYRAMRRHFNVLMDGDEPAGGQWNYDKANRKPLPQNITPPVVRDFSPDPITAQVMAAIKTQTEMIGRVDGFKYAVTHQQAEAAVEDFFRNRLTQFGDYEDAMSKRSHALFHSTLSPYLNIGLLDPLVLVRRAEALFRDGKAPLNAVEGFVRQILGWREFMAWQYWRQMPGMKDANAWGAVRPLPAFVWSGDTPLACLHHAISRAIDTGYNHHIERLMLLCNFFMLCGINPHAVNDWFMSLYIDAYDWVMPPNVIGMGLNADGGLTATKPYFSSANYINKMGDHCRDCTYDHKKRHGAGACPFNFLYWNFILQNKDILSANPRTSRNVLGLRYLDENERRQVQEQAAAFLDGLAI